MPFSVKHIGRNLRGVMGFSHLAKFTGPRDPDGQFLTYYAWRDVVNNEGVDPDFVGDAINTNFWTTNAGTGATAFAIPATPGLGGTITGATGTDATAGNRVVNLYGAPVWSGDKNCGMEIRFQVSAVTSIEWAVGFVDTHDTITTAVPLFGDIDTPTFATGIGDAALVGMDTAETLATMVLAGVGSGGLVAAHKTAIGTLTPTASTYMTIRLQLIGNDAFVSIDDGGTRTTANKTTCIEGGTLVRPMMAISGPSNSSRTYTIDYWRVWQDR